MQAVIDTKKAHQTRGSAMITRFAIFEGHVEPVATPAFRAAMLDDVLPLFRAFSGVLSARLGFVDAADDGAPGIVMILAVSYPDTATMDAALASPARAAAKDATEAVLARWFTGRLHHHVTTLHEVFA
jgi:hypothetical protein